VTNAVSMSSRAVGHNARVRVSAKVDYALRAAVELAALEDEWPVKGERLASGQEIPLRFMENILGELRQAGIVASKRGAEGGYLLARPPAEIALADVIRAVDGPLANIGGLRPDQLSYDGSATPMKEVWVAVRGALRSVLEEVTVADVAGGRLPPAVTAAIADPDAWAWR
jgi:Rrf2 family protein